MHRKALQHVRPFPRLTLENGREVDYFGEFSPDAKFRAFSRFSRFLGIAPVSDPQRETQPSSQLHSFRRVKEDVLPPARAVATPEVHSLAGRVLGSVATFAYGHATVLLEPQYVKTDSRRRVIISDPSFPAVHVLDPKRRTSFSILAGQGNRLQQPAGVAVDAQDNIYIADSKRGMVLVYDPYGRFLRYIGNFHGENMYQRPTGIAINCPAGHLYLADTDRNLIFMLDLNGNVLKRVGSDKEEAVVDGLKRRPSPGAAEFSAPTRIAARDHQVVVLDAGGTRIRVMDADLNPQATFSVIEDEPRARNRADGLAIDSDGNIYVSYAAASVIRMYNPEGKLLATFGQEGFRAGEFVAPRGLWVDFHDCLYVADTQNSRIQLFQLSAARSSH